MKACLAVLSVLVLLMMMVAALGATSGQESESRVSGGGGVGRNDKRLRAIRAYLLAGGQQKRERRSLKDVEKMMIEDEFMALLICEACGRHSCIPDYCRYCDICSDDSVVSTAASSSSIGISSLLHALFYRLYD